MHPLMECTDSPVVRVSSCFEVLVMIFPMFFSCTDVRIGLYHNVIIPAFLSFYCNFGKNEVGGGWKSTAQTQRRNSQRVRYVIETSPLSQNVLYIHVNHSDLSKKLLRMKINVILY